MHGCNHLFYPRLDPGKLAAWAAHPECTLHIQQPVVHTCRFVSHYGHALVDNLAPAFQAMEAFVAPEERQLVSFLLEDHTHAGALPTHVFEEVLELVAPVVDLAELVGAAPGASHVSSAHRAHHAVSDLARSAHGKDAVCFDHFVVGVRQVKHTWAEGAPAGGYHRMRDHVWGRLGLTAPPAAMPCNALLVERVATYRGMVNTDEVYTAMQRVLGSSCRVTQMDFSGPPASQVALLSNVTFMVSVTGTGSHQAMWLPDGE